MTDYTRQFLTTKDLAALLHLKERKIYELVAEDAIPCLRATGKLLFPRQAVEAWLARHSSGPGLEPGVVRPQVILGSHDPLLEWALRESDCGCATFFDGSVDGVERFKDRQGIASGVHVFDAQSGQWNRPLIESMLAGEPVIVLEFCWRERGLVVAAGNPLAIESLSDLRDRRVVRRQPGAGSEQLLQHLLSESEVELHQSRPSPIRSESDAALAVLNDEADVAFGLRAMATQFGLEFVLVQKERFDLLVDRRAWFEPALQKLAKFCRSDALAKRASRLGGYDVSGFGTVHYNGPV